MPNRVSRPSARQTLLLILLPMLGTVLCLRLYLHLVRVQRVYPGGYLVHHLFLGVLIELPAAFILAYLVATQASDRDYVSWVSLGGSVAFISMAAIVLVGIYWARRD